MTQESLALHLPQIADPTIGAARPEGFEARGRGGGGFAEHDAVARAIHVDAQEIEAGTEGLGDADHLFQLGRPFDWLVAAGALEAEIEAVPVAVIHVAAVIAEAVEIDAQERDLSVEHEEFVIVGYAALAIVEQLLDHQARWDVLVDPLARHIEEVACQPVGADALQLLQIDGALVAHDLEPAAAMGRLDDETIGQHGERNVARIRGDMIEAGQELAAESLAHEVAHRIFVGQRDQDRPAVEQLTILDLFAEAAWPKYIGVGTVPHAEVDKALSQYIEHVRRPGAQDLLGPGIVFPGLVGRILLDILPE